MADVVGCPDTYQREFSGSRVGATMQQALAKAGEGFLADQTTLNTWANQATCEGDCSKNITASDSPPNITRQPGQMISVFYRGAIVQINVTWWEASWTVSRAVSCVHDDALIQIIQGAEGLIIEQPRPIEGEKPLQWHIPIRLMW